MSLNDLYILPTTGLYRDQITGDWTQFNKTADELIPIVFGDLYTIPLQYQYRAYETARIWHLNNIDPRDKMIVACHKIAPFTTDYSAKLSFFEGFNTTWDADSETIFVLFNNEDLYSKGQLVSWIEMGGFNLYNYFVNIKGAVNDEDELIENPIEAIEFLLNLFDEQIEIPPRNNESFSLAKQIADTNNYKIAGIIRSNNTPAYWLSQILSNFLGSWWLNQQGEIVIQLQDPTTSWYHISGILSEHKASLIKGRQTIKNLCNQVEVAYCVGHSHRDKRLKENYNKAYFRHDDGETTKNTNSQNRYGIRKKYFEFDWIVDETTIQAIQSTIVSLYQNPTWLIEWQEEGFENIHVEKGDYVLYSWEHRKDANGLPLRNQIAQVMEKDVDFDNYQIRFILYDTGNHWPKEPELCDGRIVAGDGTYLGGERDRRILA